MSIVIGFRSDVRQGAVSIPISFRVSAQESEGG
jgi:hypothetical protein